MVYKINLSFPNKRLVNDILIKYVIHKDLQILFQPCFNAAFIELNTN